MRWPRRDSLIELAREVDILFVAVFAHPKMTRHLIDREIIEALGADGLLVNVSRGFVLDELEVIAALRDGRLGQAALDVFDPEPTDPGRWEGVPNVLLTPHIAGSTQESQENIGREVAEKLVRFMQSGTTKGAVNFPELPFTEHSGTARILHIHKNVPGALGTLDNLLAEQGLNICSQNLQTRGEIGYVVTDVDGDVNDKVIAALRAHPITIRCEQATA